MTIRVLIADDHPVFRHGLRAALDGVDGIEVVGEAADGPSAVALAVERDAEIVLTMLDNDESLFTAMRAGARGYLVKGAEEEQIVRAIHAVTAGDVVFGAGIAARALAYFASAAPS